MIVKHLIAISSVVALMSQGCHKDREADNADNADRLYGDESNEETSAWTSDSVADTHGTATSVESAGDSTGGADGTSFAGTGDDTGTGGGMGQSTGTTSGGTGGMSAQGSATPAQGSGGMMGTGGRMGGGSGGRMGTGGRIGTSGQ